MKQNKIKTPYEAYKKNSMEFNNPECGWRGKGGKTKLRNKTKKSLEPFET